MKMILFNNPRAMERMAHLLQAAAKHEQEKAIAAEKWAEAKLWWVIERSLAEAIHAMKQRRGAVGLSTKPRPARNPRLDPGTLDHFGVPPLTKDLAGAAPIS